jgi:hypothetical protein
MVQTRQGTNLHLSTLDEGSSNTLGQDLTTESVTIVSVVAVDLPTGLKQVRRSNKAMMVSTIFIGSSDISRETTENLRVVTESSSDSSHVDLPSGRNNEVVNLGGQVGQGSRVNEWTKLEGSKQASSTILLKNRHAIEDVTQCIESCGESAERQLGREIAIFGSDQERIRATRKLRRVMGDKKRRGLRDDARHDW